MAVAVALAGSLLALMVLRAPRDTVADVRHVPVARAAAVIAPSLYENFAVLRRRRTGADHLPSGLRPLRGCIGAQSRLVASSDGVRAWIVPGSASVCMIVKAPSGWGSQSGGRPGTTADYRAGKYVMGSLNVGPMRWKPHRRLLTMLFPDGTSDVQLRRGTQVTQRLTVENNAIHTRPISATSIWWRAPDGTQRHRTLH